MSFLVDGFKYCEMTQWWTSGADADRNPAAPFDQPFSIILALAVGGQVPQVFSAADIPPGTLPMKVCARVTFETPDASVEARAVLL
jgi:hypothetical protein